jgi:hypothetical protein
MVKKSFRGGLDSLLGTDEEEEVQPSPQQPTATKSAPSARAASNAASMSAKAIDEKEEESRTTLVLPVSLMDKVKAVAYWERLTLKDVVLSALEDYLKAYEKKQGAIPPMPQRRKSDR